MDFKLDLCLNCRGYLCLRNSLHSGQCACICLSGLNMNYYCIMYSVTILQMLRNLYFEISNFEYYLISYIDSFYSLNCCRHIIGTIIDSMTCIALYSMVFVRTLWGRFGLFDMYMHYNCNYSNFEMNFLLIFILS